MRDAQLGAIGQGDRFVGGIVSPARADELRGILHAGLGLDG